MEATFPYETPVTIYESTQCNISDDLFRSIALRTTGVFLSFVLNVIMNAI